MAISSSKRRIPRSLRANAFTDSERVKEERNPVIFYEFECYVHYRPFVTVEEKPEFKCKCPFKECGLAVYAGTDER